MRLSVTNVTVGYAPAWSAGTAVRGANVVLERVDHPGMPNAVTTTVATCAADAIGTMTVLPAGVTDSFRLIHRTELDGAPVGVPLTSDVSIGVSSAPGAAFAVNTRSGTLQLIAKDHGMARLTYDTSWTNSVVRLSVAVVGGTETNELLSVAADAVGTYDYAMNETGLKRFLLTFYGEDAKVIDRLVTEPFKVPGGLAIIIK